MACNWPHTDQDVINTNPHEFQLKALKADEEGKKGKAGK
jgi:hypothetical protein